MKYIVTIISIVLVLSGCSGLHSMPPNGYSKTDDQLTLRVFFDQFGDLYPASHDQSYDALMPDQKTIGRNYAFSIRTHMKKIGQTYNNDTIEKQYNLLSETISSKLVSDEDLSILFLIHGYNNSYDEARSSFDYIKSSIQSKTNKRYLFVEVYWDGLFEGPFTAPFPIAYWFEALTHSNKAGQVGLRRLINKLPENTDLTILTHSRGAGVAFSAVLNPKHGTKVSKPKFETFEGGNLGKIRIISIAPAVGTNHPVEKLSRLLPAGSKVFIGFNSEDETLKKSKGKIKVGAGKFGDTRLGSDDEFYKSAETLANKNSIILQRVSYANYKEHAIKGYIDKEESTNCLFWAATLIDEKPSGCMLVQ